MLLIESIVKGAGHNDVELFSQYLDRLKQFVSVELANWPRTFVSDSRSPVNSSRTGFPSLTLATRSVTPTSETDTIEKLLWPFKYEQLVGKKNYPPLPPLSFDVSSSLIFKWI